MVKFPGAYKDSDPYAKFSIYNGYKDFPMPGPAVWNGASTGGNAATPTTMATAVRPAATTKPPAAAATTKAAEPVSNAGAVPLYGQCGGEGFNGPTACVAGKCIVSNPWYSQCIQ
jgi:hypothetical protein